MNFDLFLGENLTRQEHLLIKTKRKVIWLASSRVYFLFHLLSAWHQQFFNYTKPNASLDKKWTRKKWTLLLLTEYLIFFCLNVIDIDAYHNQFIAIFYCEFNGVIINYLFVQFHFTVNCIWGFCSSSTQLKFDANKSNRNNKL